MDEAMGCEGVAALDKAAGQEGEATAMDEVTGAAELPPLWMWAMGCGEGLQRWIRPL